MVKVFITFSKGKRAVIRRKLQNHFLDCKKHFFIDFENSLAFLGSLDLLRQRYLCWETRCLLSAEIVSLEILKLKVSDGLFWKREIFS